MKLKLLMLTLRLVSAAKGPQISLWHLGAQRSVGFALPQVPLIGSLTGLAVSFGALLRTPFFTQPELVRSALPALTQRPWTLLGVPAFRSAIRLCPATFGYAGHGLATTGCMKSADRY